MFAITQEADVEQLGQLIGYAGAAFVAGLGLAVAARRWWTKHVAPVLGSILHEAQGAKEQATAANVAVNNVPPGTPPITERVATLETQMAELLVLKRDDHRMLTEVYELVTDPTK